MKSVNISLPGTRAIVSPAMRAILKGAVLFAILYYFGTLTGCARKTEVAARGAEVTPFDLEQTTHIFLKEDDGGRQRIVVKDPSNEKQIRLIQIHLRQEADKFGRGDFSGPANVHGDDMPGLAELRSGFGLLDVQYKALPTGGEIRYITLDPSLVKALHQWFVAQVSDHGRHATGN